VKKKGDVGGPSSLGVLALEIGVYAVLVAGYLLVVLKALEPILLDSARHNLVLYAALAVVLMLGQGLVLEVLTSLLVGFFARARRGEGLSTPGSKE
jgi:hypothetical protein